MGDHPRVKVTFLSKEAQLRRKLAAFREELARLRWKGGAPAWVLNWYRDAIRRTEEELRELEASSSRSRSSSSSSSSSGSSGSRSKPEGKKS